MFFWGFENKMSRRKVSPSRKREVWKRDHFKCTLNISDYCIRKLDEGNATVDHKIPVSQGGTNDLENLTTACIPCNQLKGSKIRDF